MRERKFNIIDRSDEPGRNNQRWNALIHNLSGRTSSSAPKTGAAMIGCASTTSTCLSTTSMPAKRSKCLRDRTILKGRNLSSYKGFFEDEDLPQLQSPAQKYQTNQQPNRPE